MDQLKSFDAQVRANLPKVEQSPYFDGEQLWLTFYICGEGVRPIAETLKGSGWANVDDREGGFIYPKMQSAVSARAIMDVAHEVQELCDQHGAQILGIDADTSPDVERSRFITLFGTQSAFNPRRTIRLRPIAEGRPRWHLGYKNAQGEGLLMKDRNPDWPAHPLSPAVL